MDTSACYILTNRAGPPPRPEASAAAYRLCGTCEQLDFSYLGLDLLGTPKKVILEHGLGGVRGNKGTCDLCTALWHALPEAVRKNSDGSYPDQTHVVLQRPRVEWSPGTFHWRSAYRSAYVPPGADDPNPAYAIDILVQQTRPNDAAEDPNQHSWDGNDSRDKIGRLKVYIRSSKKGDEISQVIGGRPLTVPDSDDAMCTIKDWVEACIEDHTECTAGHASLPPPRLIEILADGSIARLVEAGGVKEPFCALSYCWGRRKPLKTKRDNYAAFCQRIPIQDLPLTIQQAIEITHRIGYRYLWVDSICIIQDDKADWAKHTIIMGSIYANAVLTIAATGATEGSEGCYLPRPKAETGEKSLYRTEARIPCLWAGRYLGDMFAAPWDDTFSLETSFSFETLGPRQELKDSEWSARAWVFQEIYFSRRLVLFGTSQISWTCRVCTARQMSPWNEAWNDSIGAPNFGRSPNPGRSRAGSWMEMMQRYSRTKLTYTSDRLPAIAAIAREWELAHGQSYAAGLLINPESLLWISSYDGAGLQPPEIPPSDRAATWSWAHWEGAVQPFASEFSSHIKPSDIQLLRRGDEYSHHQSALVFSSFVRSATRSADPVDRRHMFPIHEFDVSMFDLVYYAVSGPGHNGFVIFDDPSSAPVDFELLSIGGCLICDLSVYCGLNLSLAVKRTKKPEGMQAGDLPPNCYQRLGVVFHVRGNFGPFRPSGKLGTLRAKLQREYWKRTEQTGLQPRAILRRRHMRWQEVALI